MAPRWPRTTEAGRGAVPTTRPSTVIRAPASVAIATDAGCGSSVTSIASYLLSIARTVCFAVTYPSAATVIVFVSTVDTPALSVNLPLGLDVWGGSSAAYQLRWLSWIGYVALIAGIVWSASRMRGRPELRDRTVGTLGVGLGATIVAIQARLRDDDSNFLTHGNENREFREIKRMIFSLISLISLLKTTNSLISLDLLVKPSPWTQMTGTSSYSPQTSRRASHISPTVAYARTQSRIAGIVFSFPRAIVRS